MHLPANIREIMQDMADTESSDGDDDPHNIDSKAPDTYIEVGGGKGGRKSELPKL